MSDDRVREIRERYRETADPFTSEDIGVLLDELDRARKVIHYARKLEQTDKWHHEYAMVALIDAVREHDAARSPELSGGTTVADADEG